MEVARKLLECGFSIPVFGAGTWMMGGNLKRDPNNDDEGNKRALAAAIEAGLTHIDTAEAYGEGQAERLVGEVLQNYKRKDLLLASKVYWDNLRHDQVLRSFEGSIQRLGVDYLDLYFVHGPNPAIPMKETFSALQKLLDQGVIKYLAVSNYTVARMIEAQQLVTHKIVATQVHYNLIYREPEAAGVLDYCCKNDIMIIAWRPVQKGALIEQNVLLFDEICRKYGKTKAQVAINWLISQPNVVTLSTMRSPEHLRENLGALDWELEQEDISRLAREFPEQQLKSSSVPLG